MKCHGSTDSVDLSGGSAVSGVLGALIKRRLEEVVVITKSSDDVGGGVAQSSTNH
jgi:hypothetical protein|tara:strand:+ start:252 stop:416 length:165 start_codon:yes stop_codon:yes gene_type:complete